MAPVVIVGVLFGVFDDGEENYGCDDYGFVRAGKAVDDYLMEVI